MKLKLAIEKTKIKKKDFKRPIIKKSVRPKDDDDDDNDCLVETLTRELYMIWRER